MKNLKLKTNRRPFVILDHDFIKCSLLNWNEKDIYIILLMYADKDSKQCFPSIGKLCEISGKSKNTVLKAIRGLEDKKILKKEKRMTKKGQTSNLYTLYDIDTILESENVEESKAMINEDEEKCMIEALKARGYTVTKEKEPETLPTVQRNNESSAQNNNNNNNCDVNNDNITIAKSQDPERYAFEQMKQHFDYDAMIQDNQSREQEIDSVMNILYKAVNTTKGTVRIAGEDKPTMVVIGKLMKLTQKSIIYAIDKFSEQTERIKNPSAYMLTILYNAPEQYHLDMKNRTSHEAAKTDTSQEEKSNLEKENIQKASYYRFGQRTYDYAQLERELISRS